MGLGALLREFFHDDMVRWALLLIVLDFGLGVASAFKLGTFTLAYVSDFLRNDVMQKLFPFFLLWVALRFAPDTPLPLPGPIGETFDLQVVAYGAFAALVLAMTGSIFNSLAELGLSPARARAAVQRRGSREVHRSVTEMIVGSENAAPPKS